MGPAEEGGFGVTVAPDLDAPRLDPVLTVGGDSIERRAA
jgi:hypothetical protein